MALESLPKIAPALFSAEQDLIQIYNKKSDTVGTINASYIGGSTPPSGVSGAIQFSNGSAFASDGANLFWDDANNRLGVGTNTPSKSLHIRTQHGVANGILLNSQNACGITITGDDYPNELLISKSNSQFEIATNGFLNIRSTEVLTINNPTIKGSGSTAATTALLVQNSLGNNLLKIGDTGLAEFGNTGGGGGGGVNAGVLRSAYYNSFGDSFTIFQTSNSTGNAYFYQGISIGTGVEPTARVHIKGSGTTAATNSLLVQNSGGTNALQIRDDLVTNFEVPVSINGWNIISSDAKIGITPYSSGLGTLFNSTTTNGANYLPCTFWTSNFFIEGTGGTQIANATGSIDASAKLQVDSTTKGFLPPRMTTTQINNIASPAEGLIAYNTTISHLCCYQAGAWVKFNHSPM